MGLCSEQTPFLVHIQIEGRIQGNIFINYSGNNAQLLMKNICLF